MKKLISILVALAMTAMLSITAFAAEYVAGVGPVALSKTLTMPVGTTTPDVDFVFTFNQDKTAGNATDAPVGPITISFDGETGDVNETTGTKTVVRTFTDVFANASFSAPGLYVYDVYESTGGSDTNANDKYTETYTNSQAHYTVQVAVNNQGKITAVTVKKVKGDDGETIPTAEQTKSGFTYGGEEQPGQDGTVEDEVNISGFNFNNNYEKKVTNTPTGTTTDPNGQSDGDSLYIEKLVTAPEGFLDNNQAFTFNITVTFPANSATETYTAQVVNAAGTAVSPAQTLTFNRGKAATETEAAVPAKLSDTFTLKNGERLVFTSIDIGATWTVTETANTDYDTSYSNAANTTAQRVTDAADNGTKVTNAYNKSTTPEGILISNLPYIALALVAIGGLVAYVVVRRRNADEA